MGKAKGAVILSSKGTLYLKLAKVFSIGKEGEQRWGI